jgi:hypothetical protein
VGSRRALTPARLARLVDELAEEGVPERVRTTAVLEELDYALHPRVHERRIPSVGAIVEPTTSHETWTAGTHLRVSWRPLPGAAPDAPRAFADGLTSFAVRTPEGPALAVFDRPAGSERDLVIIAEVTGAVVVQRHPNGVVRLVSRDGLWRWNGLEWHHEPLVAHWTDALAACTDEAGRRVLPELLTFAVHDLGARGIGALLVYRPGVQLGGWQERLPEPPPLSVTTPEDLSPLRHVLAQIDGAAVFDADGVLRHLGVRLVPSAEAEADVDGYRGMRHTTARRYSYDEPGSTVVVVSEDGPVTVLRNGVILGRTTS